MLRDQGRFEGADPLFERALAGVEKMRPPGHPDIASVLVPYAESLEQQKKFAKAKPLAERAPAIQEKAAESQARKKRIVLKEGIGRLPC